MSVLIKDVDQELYRRFKATAVLKGIKIGTALSLAMEKWLDEEQSDHTLISRMKNRDTLSKLKPKLMKEHPNKWVLISKGKLIGIYVTKQAVFADIKKLDLLGSINLIAQLVEVPQRVVRLGIRRKQI